MTDKERDYQHIQKLKAALKEIKNDKQTATDKIVSETQDPEESHRAVVRDNRR